MTIMRENAINNLWFLLESKQWPYPLQILEVVWIWGRQQDTPDILDHILAVVSLVSEFRRQSQICRTTGMLHISRTWCHILYIAYLLHNLNL